MFVQSDVKDKLSILTRYSQGTAHEHYQTVQGMVQYEVTNGITTVKGKPPSGCRTLLRLHRALAFIVRFLEDVHDADQRQTLGSIASKAYHGTLAKHHTWVIRKGVSLAVYTLPTREQLLDKLMCETVDVALVQIQDVISAIQPVYEIVQEIYTTNDILNLP